GQRSTTFLPVTYNADYQDNRVVFNTPVGSGNYQSSGDSSVVMVENAEVLKWIGGSFDQESRTFTKTGAAIGWDAGFILSRSAAFGDCYFEYTIPYTTTASQAMLIGFSTNVTVSGTGDPTVPTTLQWAIQPETTVYAAGAIANFNISENGVAVTNVV